MPRIRRVLIANRGEIAVRVIRTLRELDITSIAVFSEPDRAALHVLMADEAYPIGPGPSRESYLDAAKVLDVASARAPTRSIPATASSPRTRRSRGRAPRRASSSSARDPRPSRRWATSSRRAPWRRPRRVPGVLGTDAPVAGLDAARAAAKTIGYPLMLKAAAGGGGKGMRVVRSDAELAAAWSLTRGEAAAAFGDDRVYLERAIESPRPHRGADRRRRDRPRRRASASASARCSAATRSCSRRRRRRRSTTRRARSWPRRRAASPSRSATSTREPSSSSSIRRARSTFSRSTPGSRSSIR